MTDKNIVAVWENYKTTLMKLVTNRISDEDLAKDIVQEVFVKLTIAIRAKKEIQNLQSWLFQVTRNTINDHFRSYYKTHNILLANKHPEVDVEVNGCVCDLTGFVIQNYLPEKYGTPLYLSDIENVPQKAIAKSLNLGLSATKSRIQRGRKLLRELILKCIDIHLNARSEVAHYELKSNCELPSELWEEIKKNNISL